MIFYVTLLNEHSAFTDYQRCETYHIEILSQGLDLTLKAVLCLMLLFVALQDAVLRTSFKNGIATFNGMCFITMNLYYTGI